MGTYISLHGRQLGFDSESGSIQRPGFAETYENDESVTTISTAANVKWRGLGQITSTAAKDYTINAPAIAGLRKALTSLTTSTAARTVSLASGNFQSTAGSSFIKLTFNGIGQAVHLQALSTSLVSVLSNAGVTLST